MSFYFSLIIHTANILGIFTDPFEFEGDYGPEVNPVRQRVFELVVSQEALAKNLTDSEIINLMHDENATEADIRRYRHILTLKASTADRAHGPSLAELVTPELLNELTRLQQDLQAAGFSQQDLDQLAHFLTRYADQKVFHFLRHTPAGLLSLDKILRDKASREGSGFNLPILSSDYPLTGHSPEELKKHLLQAIFSSITLSLAPPEGQVKQSLAALDQDFMHQFFGETAKVQDLACFSSPAGQAFFYWLYQALNLHLIAEDPDLIDQVNRVKQIFAHTLGDAQVRAQVLREKLEAADNGVLFTQESDALIPAALTKDGLFHPVDRQNPQDGSYVFLRSDLWESDYALIRLDNYPGYKEGKVSLILATHKQTGEKFLLASGHGHSTKAEDGRLQISLIMEQYRLLSQKPENKNMQLLIGVDANTKSEADVKAFHAHLDTLGLVATNVGPTTIKRRMVTAQHSKAGKMAIDEEDYLITLKPENGGYFRLVSLTVGFKQEKADLSSMLPNIDNPSDHYPVGATLQEIDP